MVVCKRCTELRRALDEARASIAMLESELADAREALKLSELQRADLERYRQAYESSRPNQPERAPKDQLQLAFLRVLEHVASEEVANDVAESDSDEAADTHTDADDSARPTDRKRKKKKRHAHGRRKLNLTGLPVVEHRVDPEEVEAAGGEGWVRIGEEVSERLARRPAEWMVYRLVRGKYVRADQVVVDAPATKHEGEDQRGPVLTAPLPPGVWPGVMADPSSVAHVILSKYDDLLPLTRQERINAREGFALPKSTQCSWLKQAHQLCAPVVDAMFADAKQGAFLIATDATSARVLPKRRSRREADRGPPNQREPCDPWHVFVFIADRDHVVFRYDRRHTGAVFQRLLDGYRGNILADAASVFDVLYAEHGMTEHGCWSHARRYFYRAIETDGKRALEALAIIKRLFEIERKLRSEGLDPPTFTEQRRKRAGPILALLDAWVALHREHVEPRSPMAKALTYYCNQREALRRFLADGRIRIDNNWSEQALRNLVVGQHNWVFFANETGVAWYTNFRSLIASCKLHHLNPRVYLEQMLRLVPHWPKNRVLELAPKYWLDTVSGLDEERRLLLAPPWDPTRIESAQLLSTTVAERARATDAAEEHAA